MKRFRNFLYLIFGAIIVFALIQKPWSSKQLIRGAAIPDAQIQMLDGSQRHFHEFQGHYLLIEFWGSWCAPCRQDNPNLVRIYQQFKDMAQNEDLAFEIVSISVEKQLTDYQLAVQQDQLNWPYQSVILDPSLSFKDNQLLKQFDIEKIPTRFLINPKSRIVMVNPSIEELEEFLVQKIGG